MRIIAFGCSFTYGHGLPDCYNKNDKKQPGKYPSKYSWVNTYSNLIGLPCVNKAVPGASITRIAWNILSFNFLPKDRAIVMWPEPHRHGLINEDKFVEEFEWYNLENRRNRFYFKHMYSDVNSLYQYTMAVNGIEKYFTKNNIKFLNLEYGRSRDLFVKTGVANLHNSLDFDNEGLYFNFPPSRFFDYGVDNAHPGIKQHNWYSMKLGEQTKLKNRLDIK